jgi:hypothetical protein
LVLLDPDVARACPDGASVNRALRLGHEAVDLPGLERGVGGRGAARPDDRHVLVGLDPGVLQERAQREVGAAARPRHPESRAQTIGDAGWSKADVKRYLHDTVRRPARELGPGPDGAETGRLRDLVGGADPAAAALIPKYPSPEETLIVVAGGTAGRFSAVAPGWMGGEIGSRPVTRVIEG